MRFFAKLNFILNSQFGISPVVMLRSFRGIPRYLLDLIRFHGSYVGRLEFTPCLHDWYEEGGSTKDEYFWQDLLVARMVYSANPIKHVDIGSRVDGFVSHLASFREIEVFDIRVISTQIPGVVFKQADLMTPIKGASEYCDSISCLHALEHFGLGRYGDKIDPQGYKIGFSNMAAMLRIGGTFYLSVPIGVQRVEFNANRVFDPRVIVNLAAKNSLRLSALQIVYPGGSVKEFVPQELDLGHLAEQRYALGVFVFTKKTD